MQLSSLILSLLLAMTLALSSCAENTAESQMRAEATPDQNKEELENEVWQMEEQYWEYVQNNDTLSYKTLWHDDFIGYPSFGDGVSGKSSIAFWIPELHQDTSSTFSYELYKKAVNAIEGVVIAFYDIDAVRTDKSDSIVSKETLKLTHTWKKIEDQWLILGGMAAIKDQRAME